MVHPALERGHMTNMHTLVEPITALKVLKSEFDNFELAAEITIKDCEGNTRALQSLEDYHFGHIRKPPYRSHHKHIEILNILSKIPQDVD